MSGYEGSNLTEPQNPAVAYFAPPSQEAQALQTEGFFTEKSVILQDPRFLAGAFEQTAAANSIITPEGYNVSDFEEAKLYLINHGGNEYVALNAEKLIRTPEDVLDILKYEPRAAMYKDGQHESVYEHTLHLGEICEDELQYRPDLDPDLVRLMYLMHDGLEALAHDTVITDPKAVATKYWREAAAMTILRHSLPPGSSYMVALELYNQGDSQEAKFVNSLDKVAAYEFQLRQDVQARLHAIRQEDFVDLVAEAMPKVAIDPSGYSRMRRILIELGDNWEAWGCKLFSDKANNSSDIVDFYSYQAAWQKEAQEVAAIMPAHLGAKVMQFTPRASQANRPPQGLVQPILHEETLPAFDQDGKVVLLNSRRNNYDRGPNPPIAGAGSSSAFLEIAA